MDLYLLIFLGILIIPISAQLYINTNYKKYSNIKNNKNLSGFEVARQILDKNGLQDIHIIETTGTLTDHYDPKRKVIRLSHNIFHGTSIASSAIAAHECGHAIQDKNKYIFMNIRHFIYPLVNFSSKIAYIILLIGFLTSIYDMVYLGIFLTSFGILFQLITLPVEFNASSNAKNELKSLSILDKEELYGAEQMLKSAALTYVAGLVSSILEILRLILLTIDN